MPEVTVCPIPKGLPMASTKSPTCMASESPSFASVSPSGGIDSSATSVLASLPITLARKRRLSLRMTKTCVASLIT